MSDAGIADRRSCLFAKLHMAQGSCMRPMAKVTNRGGKNAHDDGHARELVLLREQLCEFKVGLLHALGIRRVDNKDNGIRVVLQVKN